eukprot:TRINITY_DN94852_c0_g1_i1.p1 TRINITY_DN94852_c0_g1~~TRINITY_DN94852_c0_g1_i1.p1  ORF type:complete len:421 (+),score=70.62 TRINITY_DN94852_c0_g1_i1:43-1305(+)
MMQLLTLGASSSSSAPAVLLRPWAATGGPLRLPESSSLCLGHCTRAGGTRCRLGRRQQAAAAVSVALAAAAASTPAVPRRRRRVKPGIVGQMRPVPKSIPRPPYLGPGQPSSPEDGFPEHPYAFREEVSDRKIEVKTAEQIEGMRAAGKLARATLEAAGRAVWPGVSTDEIDRVAHEFIVDHGAYPSPLGYMGFPKAVCTSVNDVIGHGIPDSRKLEDGDIVNVDVTVYLNGYHGDTSCMFFAGRPTKSAARLCSATRKATKAGIEVCGPGVDFREIGKAISRVAQEAGCYNSPTLSGHGIGSYFHGCPEVIHAINTVDQGVMKPGMTFTVEPLLVERNDCTWEMDENDGWTIRTTTGAWSAQFEHTVLITETGHEALTGPFIDYRGILAEKVDKLPRPPARSAAKSKRPGQPGRRGGFK